jgi:hypothetical protein
MSAFWWAAFARRHQALAIAQGAVPRGRGQRPVVRLADAVVAPRRAITEARAAHVRRRERALALQESKEPAWAPRDREFLHRGSQPIAGNHLAVEGPDLQARQMLLASRDEAAGRRVDARALKRSLTHRRAQHERVRQARTQARRRGDRRAELRLAHRGARIEEQIGRTEARLTAARHAATPLRPLRDASALADFRRLLDAQAALPPARSAMRGGHVERDYAALAVLAGIARSDYTRLRPGPQLAARLAIDRALEERARLRGIASPWIAQPHRSSHDPTDRARPAHGAPAVESARSGRSFGHADAARVRGGDSAVMRDAFEVEAGRKRQLGYGRD